MTARICKLVPASIVVFAVASSACDDGGGSFGRLNSTSATPIRSDSASRVTAEPERITPEFLPGLSCPDGRPFQGQVNVLVQAADDMVIRGLGFEFLDRSGSRTTPTATPRSSTAASIPVSLPVPLPSASAVPIPRPGQAGLPLGGGDLVSLPFVVQFGCGVQSSGTLVIVVLTADSSGVENRAEARVRIGR